MEELGQVLKDGSTWRSLVPSLSRLWGIVRSLMCCVGVGLILCIDDVLDDILADLTILWVQYGFSRSSRSSPFEIRIDRIFQGIWIMPHLDGPLAAARRSVPPDSLCCSRSPISRLSSVVELLGSIFDSAGNALLIVIYLPTSGIDGWATLSPIRAIIKDYWAI